LGQLPLLARISSVSGGSITAALVGLRWRDLGFAVTPVSPVFEQHVVQPIRRLASSLLNFAV